LEPSHTIAVEFQVEMEGPNAYFQRNIRIGFTSIENSYTQIFFYLHKTVERLEIKGICWKVIYLLGEP
jgi:hypothetical protein